MQKKILSYKFSLVQEIKAESITIHPESEYRKSNSVKLHPYGKGPFCKFRIERKKRLTGKDLIGVYLIIIRNQIMYIGECVDLYKRFNQGYGNISPRNCYEGGQRTNCRINKYIRERLKRKEKVYLWFCMTKKSKRKSVESRLIQRKQPVWNC